MRTTALVLREPKELWGGKVVFGEEKGIGKDINEFKVNEEQAIRKKAMEMNRKS